MVFLIVARILVVNRVIGVVSVVGVFTDVVVVVVCSKGCSFS